MTRRPGAARTAPGAPQPGGGAPAQRPAGPAARWPAGSPVRWPAEWEPHAATWLAWPHAADTWPGRLAAVERSFARMIAALHGRETVRVAVGTGAVGRAREERARSLLRDEGIDADRGIDFAPIGTDDAWLRDTGPIVVLRRDARAADAAAASARRVALAFRFDAWGGKYPPWERDAAFAAAAAAHAGIPCERVDFVLEGGSIDGDGSGTLLTTSACLLHPNRAHGAPRTREGVEARLAASLGAREVIWLGEGIAGDDTDGHVDDVSRFVAPGCVVTAVEPDAHDPNHRPLARNREQLRAARDASGKPLAVAELPMPPPLRAGGTRLPASYANFLIANGVALVPVFDAPSDARALAVLRECLPGRELVPIGARDLVRGFGAVHCLTQQEPREPAVGSRGGEAAADGERAAGERG